MFRSLSKASTSLSDLKLQLPDIEITALKVAESSVFVGKTLAGINLRRLYGVTIVAIRRNEETKTNPDGDFLIQNDDTLFALGAPDKVSVVAGLCQD